MSEKLKSFVSTRKEALINPRTEAVVRLVGSKALDHLKTAGEAAGRFAKSERVQAKAAKIGGEVLKATKIIDRKGQFRPDRVGKAIENPSKTLRKVSKAIRKESPLLGMVVGRSPSRLERTVTKARELVKTPGNSEPAVLTPRIMTTVATKPREQAPEPTIARSTAELNALYTAPDLLGNQSPLPQFPAEGTVPGAAGPPLGAEAPPVAAGPKTNS